jgi:NAD(P)-dependent dehydrogenase (short-subunit alcohol dehydrogenase family)
MGLLTGRRIAVTGASRGLGRAFALALAAEGADLVINGTNAALLAEVAAEAEKSGARVATVIGTIADDNIAARIVATCVENYGAIDIMINNAGVVRDRTLMKMTTEEFDEVIAVNLRGTWSASRHAAIAMSKTGGGMLLQIVSCAAIIGSVGSSNYAASKAGVLGMLYAWDTELERHGIRTNAIWPVAQTDMTKVMFRRAADAAEAEGKEAPTPEEMGFGTAEEVAKIVVALCRDEASHVRSQIFTFSGQKFAPWQHPYELPATRQASWTVEELSAAITDVHVPVFVPKY